MSDEIREGGSNAALTLGILSLIFIMFFPIAGLVMGIIGLRRSKMNERHPDAAWVLSVIGIVLNSSFLPSYHPLCSYSVLRVRRCTII